MTYPLYTASLNGKSWDGDIEYQLVIITRWSDRTEGATGVASKAFYFQAPYWYLNRMKDDENWCRNIFTTFKNYEKMKVDTEIKTSGFYGLSDRDKNQLKSIASNINYYNENNPDNTLFAEMIVDGGNKLNIYRGKRLIVGSLEIDAAVHFVAGILNEFHYRMEGK